MTPMRVTETLVTREGSREQYPEAARAASEGRDMNSDEQRADRARRLKNRSDDR